MNHLLVVMLNICTVGQLNLAKLYQKRTVSSLDKIGSFILNSMFFSMVSGLVCGSMFFAFALFKIEFTPVSLLMAACVSAAMVIQQLVGIVAISKGSIALYTMFLMLGGMILPFFAGIFFWDEHLSATKSIGIVLLCSAMLISTVSGKNLRKKSSKVFYFLCAATFIISGTMSILSKAHQISSDTVETNQFGMYVNLIACVISAGLYLVVKPKYFKVQKECNSASGNTAIACIFGIVNCSAFLLQLVGAKSINASVLFPMKTGGTIVLSVIAGRLFFKEKISVYSVISTVIALAATVLFAL